MARSRKPRKLGLAFGGHIPTGSTIAAHDSLHHDPNCFDCNPNRELTKEQLAEECERLFEVLERARMAIMLMDHDLSSHGEQILGAIFDEVQPMIVKDFESETDPSLNGYFVTVTRNEAMQLIESLAHQLSTGDPNTRRMESFDQKGRFFTVAVADPHE